MKPEAVRALTWGGVWLGLALLAWLAWQLAALLALAFLALLIASAAYPLVGAQTTRGVPRPLAVVLIYAVALGGVAAAVVFLLPPLVAEAVGFVSELPSIVRRFEEWLRSTLPSRLLGPAPLLQQLEEAVVAILPPTQALLAAPLLVVNVVVNVVVVISLSAMLLLEARRLRRGALSVVPARHRGRVAELGEKAITTLGMYVRGQLVVMTVVGVATAVGLMLLGVPFALALGFLAFLAEAIPVAGPYISGIPIVIVALGEGTLTGVLAAVLVIAIQQAEAYLLTPWVQKHAVKLSPVVVLLAILAGARLAGLLGAIVAVPMVAVLQVVLREIVVASGSGDDSSPEEAR